jgi:NAD(P)-dependent dehydrogenase (short-subunit alcohol dehydrogenase family)
MGLVGPWGFFLFIAVLMIALSVYATYRMTQRSAPSVAATGKYAPILNTSSVVALSYAQEVFVENAYTEEEALHDLALKDAQEREASAT